MMDLRVFLCEDTLSRLAISQIDRSNKINIDGAN